MLIDAAPGAAMAGQASVRARARGKPSVVAMGARRRGCGMTAEPTGVDATEAFRLCYEVMTPGRRQAEQTPGRV